MRTRFVTPDECALDSLHPPTTTHTHTHTYTGTLAMMLGPQQVPQEHSSRAGLIMVFFLTTGLAVGSWVGVGLKQLMDHTGL